MATEAGGFGVRLCDTDKHSIIRYFTHDSKPGDQSTSRLIAVPTGTKFCVLVAPDNDLRLAPDVDLFVSVEITEGDTCSSQTWRIKGSAAIQQISKMWRIQKHYSFADDGSEIRKTPLFMPPAVLEETSPGAYASSSCVTVTVELGRMAPPMEDPTGRELSQPPPAYGLKKATNQMAVVSPSWYTACSPELVLEFRNVSNTSVGHAKQDKLPVVHGMLPVSDVQLLSAQDVVDEGQGEKEPIAQPKTDPAMGTADAKATSVDIAQTKQVPETFLDMTQTSTSQLMKLVGPAAESKAAAVASMTTPILESGGTPASTLFVDQERHPESAQGQSSPVSLLTTAAVFPTRVVYTSPFEECPSLDNEADLGDSMLRDHRAFKENIAASSERNLSGRTLRPVIVDVAGNKLSRQSAHMSLSQYYQLSADNPEDRDYKDGDDNIMSDLDHRQHDIDDDGWGESDQIEPSELDEDDLSPDKSSVMASSPPRPAIRRSRRSQTVPRLRSPSSSPELPSPPRPSRSSITEDGEDIIVTPRSERAQIISARAQAAAAARSVASPSRKKRSRSITSALSQDEIQQPRRASRRQRRSQDESSHRLLSPADEMDCDANLPDRSAQESQHAFIDELDKSDPQCKTLREVGECSDDEDDDEDYRLPIKLEDVGPLRRHETLLQMMARNEVRALSAEAEADTEEPLLPAPGAEIALEADSKQEPDVVKHEPEMPVLMADESPLHKDTSRRDDTREDSAMSVLEESVKMEESADVEIQVEAKLEDTRMENQAKPYPAFVSAKAPAIEDGTATTRSSPAPSLSEQLTAAMSVVDVIAPRRKPALQHIPEVVIAPVDFEQDRRDSVTDKQNHAKQQSTPVPAAPSAHRDAVHHLTDAVPTEPQQIVAPMVGTADPQDNAQQVALLLLKLQENDFDKRQAIAPFAKKELDIKKQLLHCGHRF